MYKGQSPIPPHPAEDEESLVSIVEKEIELSISSVLILRLSIESISGKVGIYILEKENGT